MTSSNFQLNSGLNKKHQPTVSADAVRHEIEFDTVAVNLRYYQASYQCFSKWQKTELKAFSSWCEKISNRTEAQITSTTQTCHAHINPSKRPRLPSELSPDIQIYGLDVSSKARAHGFFALGNFFLVWLDRDHKLLSK